MATTASAKKRIRQNEKRRVHNRQIQGRARAAVKKAREAIDAENWDEAEELIQAAYTALDKAASKNVIHENKAARTKSRLMSQLHRAQDAASS